MINHQLNDKVVTDYVTESPVYIIGKINGDMAKIYLQDGSVMTSKGEKPLKELFKPTKEQLIHAGYEFADPTTLEEAFLQMARQLDKSSDNMFGSRDTMKEAMDYLEMVAKSCGPENALAVTTAAMVVKNTVIKLIADDIKDTATNFIPH